MPTIAIQKSGGARSRQRNEAGDAVEKATGTGGGQRADDDGQHGRERHCDQGELQRGRKGLESHLDRRPVLSQGLAEIQGHEVLQVLEELHVNRLVQAVQTCKGLARLETRIERQVERRRIAGQTREEEDERQQADHRNYAVICPPADIAEHHAEPLDSLAVQCERANLSRARPDGDTQSLRAILASGISLLVVMSGFHSRRLPTRV